MTKPFRVTKPFEVTKRRCAGETAVVAIDGADSQGKANDKEVCGDAAAVSRRRSEALRRRAAAIQERLDKIKPVAKAPVSAAALAADRAEMQRVDGIAAKTAGKVATDEHTFDQFVDEQTVRLEEGMYPSAEEAVSAVYTSDPVCSFICVFHPESAPKDARTQPRTPPTRRCIV